MTPGSARHGDHSLGDSHGAPPHGALEVVVVAAIADNGVIGVGNALPWRLPRDMAHFKAFTWGHTLVMGRQTFLAIGKALPGRRTIVLSRSAPARMALAAQGALALPSLADALQDAVARGDTSVFAAGGAEVYREALAVAHRLEITRVHGQPEGDTRFPEVDWSQWECQCAEHHPPDDQHAYGLTFETWRRIGPARLPAEPSAAPRGEQADFQPASRCVIS